MVSPQLTSTILLHWLFIPQLCMLSHFCPLFIALSVHWLLPFCFDQWITVHLVSYSSIDLQMLSVSPHLPLLVSAVVVITSVSLKLLIVLFLVLLSMQLPLPPLFISSTNILLKCDLSLLSLFWFVLLQPSRFHPLHHLDLGLTFFVWSRGNSYGKQEFNNSYDVVEFLINISQIHLAYLIR